MPQKLSCLLLGLALFAAAGVEAVAQVGEADLEALKKAAPKIYLDCGSCDLAYTKNEIPFVNYVRDRKEADVHVLVTSQTTASGGREYTLTFMGQNGFSGIDDSFRYFSKQDDTEDDIRKGLVHALKHGLAGYVARTPIACRLDVRFRPEERPSETKDRWNHWVFNIGADGYFNGEESNGSGNFGFNFSANRITEEWKLRLGLSASFGRDRFSYDGLDITSTQESYEANGLLVKSLGPHWSAGLSFEADSSSYNNTALRLAPAAAIEYNIFPYAESTRRQFVLVYRLGFEGVRYRETTIYNTLRENLLLESLSATLSLKEKWGSISGTVSGSHYFHDIKMNQIGLSAFVQLNLVKGLNAYMIGGGSRIHNQLSLVKGDASLEEILLRRRQLATSYNYFAMFGLSYTFGSVYTNVVNPRFAKLGGGSGGVTINIH
ncbi:MAG: hypothetical protein JW843_04860 [Candidatus Aminicenantes bacterium]|nr:hypothetical protein [Candidatus Aminicenantes bacterium]